MMYNLFYHFRYCLLWFNYQYENLEYLYMTKVLNGFVESNYSYYYAAKQTVQGLFIILIMPRLKIHPSLFCIIALLLQTLRLLLSIFFSIHIFYVHAQFLHRFPLFFQFFTTQICKTSLVKLSQLAENSTIKFINRKVANLSTSRLEAPPSFYRLFMRNLMFIYSDLLGKIRFLQK